MLRSPHLSVFFRVPSVAKFTLHLSKGIAIVPPPSTFEHRPVPRLGWGWRLGLVLLAAVGLLVLVTAWRIDPYRDGRVWLVETHTQLGLAPCSFKVWTDLPCPSCGMTSSFALLMHGDVWNSLKANTAGTALAVLVLVFIPWSVVSSIRGRLWGVRQPDYLIVWVTLGFMAIMFVRWGIVLAVELL